jgi:serine protease Do
MVMRGDIGADVQSLTSGLAAGLGLSRSRGVLVADVTPGGPADNGGLRTGDVVLSLNAKPMENARQFQVNLYQQPLNAVVKLEVERASKILTLSVVVSAVPPGPARLASLVDPGRNFVARLGILALPIDRKLSEVVRGIRRSYGILVAALAPAPTAPIGLFQAGDVIYQVGVQPVSTMQELSALLDKVQPGESVVLQIERDGKLRYLEASLN